ncbi:MAG: acyltransferase [Anaerolineae bacterium]
MEWVDYARGIASFLVVQVHVIYGLRDAGMEFSTEFNAFVDGWKFFSFNMPVFFFMSGLFLARSVQKPLGVFIGDKLRTLAYPYFVWSLLTLLMGTFTAGAANSRFGLSWESVVSLLYRPTFQYWFLFILFPVVIAAALMAKRQIDLRWLFVPTFLMMLASILVEYPSLWQESVLFYTVWLSIGVIFGDFTRRTLETISNRNLLLVLVSTGLVWGSFAFGGEQMRIIWVRPVILAFGLVMVFSIATFLARFQALGIIRRMGHYSLEVYLAHIIFGSGARIILDRVFNVETTWLHIVLGTIAAIGVPVAMKIIFDRIGFQYAFTFPARKQKRSHDQSDTKLRPVSSSVA